MLRMMQQYSAASVRRYFSEALNHDDYYRHGTETKGLWRGVGAELLGLTGRVERDEFSHLSENRHPFAETSLTPRTKVGRRVGYDFNFNAPKSVSVVYAVTRDEDILWAFRKSVWDTMREIETEMMTRVRRDGANHDRVTGTMLWAEYLHLTTRPIDGVPDPHVHMHCFAMNCTYDQEEQRWKAGQFGGINAQMPTFQAAYHSRLASNLVEKGYPVQRTKHAFEIVGVPESAMQTCSRRSEHIESLAADLGYEDKNKARLGARTRERKQDIHSIDDLHSTWSERLTPDEVSTVHSLKGAEPREHTAEIVEQQDVLDALRNEEWDRKAEQQNGKAEDRAATEEPHRRWGPHLLVSLSANNAVKAAANTLFERDAVVTESRLREVAMKYSYGKATPQQVYDSIKKRPELIERTFEGRTYYTTTEAIKEERFLVDFARNGRGARRSLGLFTLSMAGFRLDRREREVLGELLSSKDRVTLFKQTGPTRRPELSRAAMTAVQEAGHKLLVVAPTSVSARQAEQDYKLEKVLTAQQVIHDEHLHEKLKGPMPSRLIWVEDAGRLGTRSIAGLARVAKSTGCRLLLSGDNARSRTHERGDPFRLLRDEAGMSTVEHIVMKDKQSRLEQVVHSLQWSAPWTVPNELKELGAFQLSQEESLIEDAARFYTEEHSHGRKVVLVTPGYSTLGQLTGAVRENLRDAGVLTGRERSVVQLLSLGWDDREKSKKDNYHRGMVIDFHMPSRGFRSGDRARVLGVDSFGGVWVLGRFKTPERLNLRHANRFTVSKVHRGRLAVGDRIRLNRYTKSALGRPLRAGSVVTVKAFNPRGDIVVDGMRILPRNFGHFEYDYATTAHRLHGRRADSVGFVARAGDYAGAEAKDVAAAGEASRKSFRVFVDDEEGFTNLMEHERPTHSAIDVEDHIDELDLQQEDYEMMFRRAQPDIDQGIRHGR